MAISPTTIVIFGASGDLTQKINNTRAAIQGLAEITLQGRQEMHGQGAITESEGKLAERAKSGDISLTPGELKQLANAAKIFSCIVTFPSLFKSAFANLAIYIISILSGVLRILGYYPNTLFYH